MTIFTKLGDVCHFHLIVLWYNFNIASFNKFLALLLKGLIIGPPLPGALAGREVSPS